jgi:hypothetical protein
VGQLLAGSALASAGGGGGGGGGGGSAPGLTVSFGEAADPTSPWDSLANYSSKGPTMDGRIKPDVVAPG